jgi:AcrR family transcriptional regulator
VSTHSDTRTEILEAAWEILAGEEDATVPLEVIAKKAGVSRQALYLHFGGRAELLGALVTHIQSSLGLAKRMAWIDEAVTGPELLERLVQVTVEYTPEIYPVTRALDAVRRSDPAAAAIWSQRLESRMNTAREFASRLAEADLLRKELTTEDAATILWSIVSLRAWEDLIVVRGWSKKRYVRHTTEILKRALLANFDAT